MPTLLRFVSLPAALVAVSLTLGSLGCGGKVVFETGSQDGGAGGALFGPVVTSSVATSGGLSQTSTGDGGPCLTAATVGSGDFGPSPVSGTLCATLTSPGACPVGQPAANLLTPDPCYMIQSLTECGPVFAKKCCYNTVEVLSCKGD